MTFNLAVKLGLALGYLVAGILGNYLTIPLLGPAELIFTPAVFFLAIRTLPIKLAALVILAVLAHLSWHWDSLHNSTLFLLECCVYWWACRKGWNVFFADLGFWLLLGLPLAFAMLSFSDIESFELVPVLLLKQPVNALAYLLLTNLLLWLKIFRNQQLCLNSGADTQASSDVRFLSIEQVLRDALLLMLLIPIFLGVYLTKNNIDKQYSKKLSSLTSSYALATKVQLDEFLLRHQQGIEALAKVLFEPKESRQNEMQRILVEFHKLYDGFITMLIAHPDGSLWLSSPPELMVSGVSISDRSYFRQPRETLEAFISEAFQGKGFGTDPIVAISAPIINQQGQFAGLVEGSLNLYKFAHFAPASEQEVTHFLVLDRFDQVVYSSESLNLAFLQKLKPRYIEDREFGQVVQLKSSGGGFLFSEEMTRNGWRVMYLISKDYYFYSISEAYRWLFVFTLLIVIVTLGLASFLTRLVERPLSELLKSFHVMGKGEPVIKQTPSRFYEFNLLFDTFYRTYHQLKIAHEKEQEALSKKLAAEKQYEAMTEILSKVSHELRTPLNAILGQAQLLLMESPPDRYHQALTQIETSSRFLVSLIDDLLQLSKIDVGVLTLSSQAVELNSVVNQALQMLELEIGAKDLAVSMDLKATNGSFVAADPNRLLQVIVNLISNAIKYNRPNGKIRIESQADQSWIRLSVADTGFGIEKEHYDKVFQPFQRLGHEHGNIEGSGIGLSLSYRLVELMGGKMDFTSEEDVGSCFFFELKRTSLTEDKSTKEQEHKQSPLNLSQTRVLYIEDNRVNYMIIEAWLQKKGVQQINRASTGREAIEMIKAFTPDLVLCDLGLPDMDGFELFRKLIKINSSLRIIALTADNSASTQAQCRRMGFSGFVAKPVEFGVLQREMARVLSL